MKTAITLGLGSGFGAILKILIKDHHQLEIAAEILTILEAKIGNRRGVKCLISYEIEGTAARGRANYSYDD